MGRTNSGGNIVSVNDVAASPLGSPTATYTAADYSTLNTTYPPSDHSGEFAWVIASQGIRLINYKPSGWYYSDGSSWSPADDIESLASQLAVDTSGFTNSASGDIQSVLADLDGAITAGGGGGGTNSNQDTLFVALNSNQSFTNGVATKFAFDDLILDTQGTWDAVNKRFIPNVAGYYGVDAVAQLNYITSSTYVELRLYKNGSLLADRVYDVITSGGNTSAGQQTVNLTGVVQLNGAGDYLELFGFQQAATANMTRAGMRVTFLHS